MHVNQVMIVSINFHQLVLVFAIDIDIMIRTDVLMWQDNLRMPVLVSWRLLVVNFKISILFCFINLEKEILFRNDLFVSTLSNLLFVTLILELNKADLLFDDFVNAFTDLS